MLLCMDWLLNRINFEFNAITNGGLFYMGYMYFMWTYVQVYDEYIYPNLTFDSTVTWMLAIVLLPSSFSKSSFMG